MKYAAYVLPWRKPELLEGEGCIKELPEHLLKKKIKNVLLVTDKGIMSLGLTDELLGALRKSGIETSVFNKTVPNPTIKNIEDALNIYKEKKCKAIIAFGGGSAMDCAKGVGARVARPRKKIRRMKGLLRVIFPMPLFCR